MQTAKLKRLPIGIQSFEKIIKEDYLYIDKTDLVYEIISNFNYVFLSRPRRFGKSLLINTIAEVFRGKKELFKGLKIESLYDFKEDYPVIKINQSNSLSKEDLFSTIIRELEENRINLEIDKIEEKFPHIYLRELIFRVYKKYNKPVVILIDEYNRPIISNVEDSKVTSEYTDILRSFYAVIKDSDSYIKFAMLTGVSKFAKLSIFSGLNNLEDISLNPNFATICGYTQTEIKSTLNPYLENVDLKKLKQWYNGYNFLGDSVYNPFGIFLFIKNNKVFKNYWFSTGTPSFLIKLIQKNKYNLTNLENIVVDSKIMDAFDIEHIDLDAIMFQAGYLTIKKVEETPRGFRYKLGFPNNEVKFSFNDVVFRSFVKSADEVQNIVMDKMIEGKLENMEKDMTRLFSSIAYNNFTNNYIEQYEGFYASVVYAYFSSLGLDVIAEDVTNIGRIDLTVKYKNFVYIFEFKVDSPEAPIKQIKEREYYKKYQDGKNQIYLIGINFDSKKREIKSFENQTL